MKTRTIGKSELVVSEIGLGCMSLPTNQEEARSVVDAALDYGITYFDTADLYDAGQNEIAVGQALNKRRNEIILGTKVGNVMNPDGKTWTWNPSKKHIISSVKESLRRLQTDYIDLYQLHGGTMEDDVEETIDAFETLKKEGLIREYGISSIRPTVIERFTEMSDGVSVMMQYNLLDRKAEQVFPLLQQRNNSVIVRGAIGKGLLTETFAKRLANDAAFPPFTNAQLSELLPKIEAIEPHMQAAALHYLLQSPVVATALIGSRTVEQLQNSLHAYNQTISEDTLQQIEQLIPFYPYVEHLIDFERYN